MTRSHAPLVGIEVDLEATPAGKRYAKCYEAVFDAVAAAGGAPVLLPPAPEALALRALAAVDALVVPGGDDLPAGEWGEVSRACPRFVAVDARRLEHGRRLLGHALAAGRPVLGVCYGAQLLNVVLGGTMVQDIPLDLPAAGEHRNTRHAVVVEPGTLLAQVLGGPGRVEVVSRHHQANREPGRGLRVSARADDGVVEAIESVDPARFVLGVQWHPEDPAEASVGPAVFAALVESARRSARDR